MLIHHLSNDQNGVTIREPEYVDNFNFMYIIEPRNLLELVIKQVIAGEEDTLIIGK